MGILHRHDGFALLETLIAAALLAGAISGLAHVVTRSVEQAGRSERAMVALTLAQAKLEQLRGAAFVFDATGARIDGPELVPSAGDALTRDAPPHVEALDRFGAVIAPDAPPTFVRRWLIAPSPADPDTLVVAVCVLQAAVLVRADACVWTTRTRQP